MKKLQFGCRLFFWFIPPFQTLFLLSKCILFLIWLGLPASALCWLTGLSLQRGQAFLPFSFSRPGVVYRAGGKYSGYKSTVWKCHCVFGAAPTSKCKTLHLYKAFSVHKNELAHISHNHAFKKLRTKFTYAVNTLRFIKWNMSLQTCWHIETDSHTHTRAQTVQPLKHQPLVQNLIWNFLWVRISENGVAIKAALVQYLWIKPGLNSRD